MSKLRITSITVGMQKNARFYNIPSFLIKIGDESETSTPALTKVAIKSYIKENPNINHVVIYGEDPLKNKLEVEKLLNDIWKEGMKITVYTNGNLPILNPLSYHYRISLYIVKVQESEMNIQMLRNLCLYSTDYLLCFQDDPVNLEERSNALLKNILDTDEEFFATMLKKHSPSSHIVYIPKNKDDIKEVKNICFKTGRYFNTFI